MNLNNLRLNRPENWLNLFMANKFSDTDRVNFTLSFDEVSYQVKVTGLIAGSRLSFPRQVNSPVIG